MTAVLWQQSILRTILRFVSFLDVGGRFAGDTLHQRSALGRLRNMNCSKRRMLLSMPSPSLGAELRFRGRKVCLDVPQSVAHPAWVPQAARSSSLDAALCYLLPSPPPPQNTKSSFSSPKHTGIFQCEKEVTIWGFPPNPESFLRKP